MFVSPCWTVVVPTVYTVNRSQEESIYSLGCSAVRVVVVVIVPV